MRQTMDSLGRVEPPGLAAAGVPLLRTRFAIPASPPDLVARDRLLDIVRRGVGGPLTLVSALAGSGKTVLLSSWIALRRSPGPVVWMTMDDGDERPGVFWSYVIEGLARSGVDVSGVGVPARADSVHQPLLDRLALCIAAEHEPVVLVLDDGDYLVDRALGGDVSYLLRHCDGMLRVVLVTRTDPSLPLHRYRLDGAITEIRAAELAFTEREATALLQRSGLDLTAAEVAAVLDRTGGWPAGLKFAAISLAGRTDPVQAIHEFTGDEGNVAAYLVSEVLDAQPPELREILLRTSVVDQLQPGLLEALTGNPASQRVLELMSHGNFFIQPVSGSHGYYRYQSLFREFLRSQLAYERPAWVPELHQLAADWFARNDRLQEAIGHASAAGAWADAAAYLVDDLSVGVLLAGRAGAQLAGLFAGVPDDGASPDVSIVRAALAITTADAERAGVELGRAMTRSDPGARGSAPKRRLSIALVHAHRAYLASDVESGLAAVTTAEHLLRELVPRAVTAHPELVALVARCKGGLLLLRGDLASAQAVLAEATRAAEAPGCEEVLMASLGMDALVEALTGRLRRARELVYRADAVARDSGAELDRRSAAAAVAMAWVAMEEYDIDAARDLVRRAEATELGYDKVTAVVLTLVRARLLRAQGDVGAARAELSEARDFRPGEALPGWLDAWLGAAEAALLPAEGQLDDAVGTIDRLEEPDRPEVALTLQLARLARREIDGAGVPAGVRPGDTTSLDTQVSAWLVQSARSAESGDSARAEAALERALRLAAPERLRRPFREASPAVRRSLREGGDLAARYPWLGGAGSASPRGRGADLGGSRSWPRETGTRDSHVLIVAPLTDKEQELLGHLADLLSTEEIAGAMYISVNTVRTHVRSILRKLGVSRRNAAVRRAWEVGLLPSPAEVARLGGSHLS